MKEALIGLLLATIILLSYKLHQALKVQATEKEDYENVIHEIDSSWQAEEKLYRQTIKTLNVYIDSLDSQRATNTKIAYEKIRMFDTVTVYYLDSFLASNYDSLARFRYGTPQTHSR